MSRRQFNLGNHQQRQEVIADFVGMDEDGNTVNFSFEFKKAIPGSWITGILARSMVQGRGEGPEMMPFVRRCLKSTEQERWDRDIEADDSPYTVEFDAIKEIYAWLMGEYTNRPKEQDNASTPGPSATPTTSTEQQPSNPQQPPMIPNPNWTPEPGSMPPTP